MKKLTVFVFAVIASFCFGVLGFAQGHQLRGQIPFDFTAGSTRLPAGEYRITYDRSGLATFRNVQMGNSATMLVGTDQGQNDGSCKLIFTRYRDQYFLKQSSCNVAGASFFIPTSGLEKKAQERAALNHDAGQTFVAMK